MAKLAAPYAPRKPTETVLYAAVRESLETFVRWARETYDAPLPRYVEDELRAYLRCGVFAHGFVRAHCDGCGHDLLVAFSCKGRGVCPSCAGRRMANTAAHLVDRVLPAVPVRQWVLSLPWELRRLAAFDARVLTALDRLFVEQILAHHRRAARADGLDPTRGGAVTFVQRFGGSLNLHVHFHVVVLDGVFERDGDRAVFHEAAPPSPGELDEILRRTAARISTWLRRRGYTEAAEEAERHAAIDACAAAAMHPGVFAELEDQPPAEEPQLPTSKLAASYSGFSLHAGVRMTADDDVGRERLCRYGARPALALRNLRKLPDGRYAYRSKYARRGRAHHRIMTPLELLARLAALIPPPRHPLVRYHGVLGPHSSWRTLVTPNAPTERDCHVPTTRPSREVPAVPEPARDVAAVRPHRDGGEPGATSNDTHSDGPSHQGRSRPRQARDGTDARSVAVFLTPNILSVAHWSRLCDGLLRAATPRVDWSTLMRRTFAVDVLRCPKCAGRLRVVSVLTRPEPVRAILEHLDLAARAPPLPGPRDPSDLLEPLLDA